MRSVTRWAGLVAVAMGVAWGAPVEVSAQVGNQNSCVQSGTGTVAVADIVVDAVADPISTTFDDSVLLSDLVVTFPSDAVSEPAMGAYQAQLLNGGANPLTATATLYVGGTGTSPGVQVVYQLFTMPLYIEDPNEVPRSGDEYLRSEPIAVSFDTNTMWTASGGVLEMWQTRFEVSATLGGLTASMDCQPNGPSSPFVTVAYSPPDCDPVGDCSGHGNCDPIFGTCLCEPGYSGLDCSIAPPFCDDFLTCNGNGACDPWGNCDCYADWTGTSCSIPLCIPSIHCNGQGSCDAGGNCVCDAGWTGSDCSTPTCDPVIDCNGHGQCVAGACVCDTGYSGGNCSVPACDPLLDCNGGPVAAGDIEVYLSGDVYIPPSHVTWDSADFSLFGEHTVNLGDTLGVNDMTLTGMSEPTLPGPPVNGRASGSLISFNPNLLTIPYSGSFVCEGVGACGVSVPLPWEAEYIVDTGTLMGLLVDDGTLPPALSSGAILKYTLDGSVDCYPEIPLRCEGRILLNAFSSWDVAASPGPGVPVEVEINTVYTNPDGSATFPVTIAVSGEVSNAGAITVTTTTAAAGTLPDGVFFVPGTSSPYFDITLDDTLTYEGEAVVCLSYQAGPSDDCNRVLLHREGPEDDPFVDKTLDAGDPRCPSSTCPVQCNDEGAGQLCAAVSGFSPFVVAWFDPDVDGDGIAEHLDNCPSVHNPDQLDNDLDGTGDVCDDDADGDGVLNVSDNCPINANADQADNDEDGVGDFCDPDNDNDGWANSEDNCPFNANPMQVDFDDDGEGDACDGDIDGDTVPNLFDNCPLDPNAPDADGQQSDLDGDLLGDVCDPDLDGDGVDNVDDNCESIPNVDQVNSDVNEPDGDPLGDACDADDDADGLDDEADNCPVTANPGQGNNDGDALGDACDDDDDNDGVLDQADNCPIDHNPDQANNGDDEFGNVCDADDDNDGLLDTEDSCPFVESTGSDVDGDGLGDECDADADDDGQLNEDDNCWLTANPDQSDLDGDGAGDACDGDLDGDGALNEADNCPWTSNTSQADLDGDGMGDACDDDRDGDGVENTSDNCPDTSNSSQADNEGDGLGDACDTDDDNDGAPDAVDNCPRIANADQADFDADGLGDFCDGDIDGDGVQNEPDLCERTPLGTLIDPANGCSIEQLCPCEGPRNSSLPWKNHGKYVSCVSKTANSFREAGLISEAMKGQITSAAAESSCGHKN